MSPNNTRAAPAGERLSNSAPTTSTNDKAKSSRPRRPRHQIPGQTALDINADALAVARRGGKRRTAYVTLFRPCGRRHMWWFIFTCPHGDGTHFGWLDPDMAAKAIQGKSWTRVSGCGRLVRLRVGTVRDMPAEAVSA